MLDKDEKLDPRIWKILAVVLLGPFMTVLDSTVVNVSLSSLAKDLHTSIGSIQWIVSGYLLSLALMLPLSGWLVDRLGAKRIYLIRLRSIHCCIGAVRRCAYQRAARGLSRLLRAQRAACWHPCHR